jgi:excisionase family DNA binding protein
VTATKTRTAKGERSPRRGATASEPLKRLQDADAKLAERLPASALDALAQDTEEAISAVTSRESGRTRRSTITGEPVPSPAEMTRLRRKNLLEGFAERHRLLQGSLSVAEVAELLQVGRQTPHDRVKAGRLLAVRENGRLVFPDWQFDPDGPDGVLEGFADVLHALQGPLSPLGRIRWFLRPKVLLNGKTPVEALLAGQAHEAIAEANSVGLS